jgi:hypothetical protein
MRPGISPLELLQGQEFKSPALVTEAAHRWYRRQALRFQLMILCEASRTCEGVAASGYRKICLLPFQANVERTSIVVSDAGAAHKG